MVKLDQLDVKILSELQKNGRLTKVKLSEKVNLSPSACHERVARLQEKGVVSSYTATLDISRILSVDTVFTEVTLKSHRQNDFRVFEDAINKSPYVVECLAVGGGFDYILRFIVNNIAHYQEVLEEFLTAGIGIDRYFSYVVTKEIKPYTGFPLSELLARNSAEV